MLFLSYINLLDYAHKRLLYLHVASHLPNIYYLISEYLLLFYQYRGYIIVLTVFLTFLIRKSIISPLKELADLAKRMAQGDFLAQG